MPQHTVADALRRERLLVLVLAAKSAVRTVLSRQLELLNCAVECVETTAEAQLNVVKRSPHFLFIECARFPMHIREITDLFRTSGGDSWGRPLLIGLGCEDRPGRDRRACGLDEYLRLPPTLNAIEALLDLPSAKAEDALPVAAAASYGCPGLDDCEALVWLPEDLQAAMLKAFVDDTVMRLERIEANLAAYDLKQASRDVHGVKSGCLQIGYTAMAECCDQLRRAIHASDMCAAQLCFRALGSAFHAIANRLPKS